MDGKVLYGMDAELHYKMKAKVRPFDFFLVGNRSDLSCLRRTRSGRRSAASGLRR